MLIDFLIVICNVAAPQHKATITDASTGTDAPCSARASIRTDERISKSALSSTKP